MLYHRRPYADARLASRVNRYPDLVIAILAHSLGRLAPTGVASRGDQRSRGDGSITGLVGPVEGREEHEEVQSHHIEKHERARALRPG